MRTFLVDCVAAGAGVLLSWAVADAVVSASEGTAPLVARPRDLPSRFERSERMAGVYHLAMAGYAVMHLTYHALWAKHRPAYHGTQAVVGACVLCYHAAWSYPRHAREARGG